MERTPKSWQAFTVAVVVLLILLSVYSSLSVSNLQGQLSAAQNQNLLQQNQLQEIQYQLGYLQAQLRSLSQEVSGVLPPTPSFYISSICVSAAAECWGNAYSITLQNNGTTVVPAGYSLYLSFNDVRRSTSFGFNVTAPQIIAPGQGGQLSSTSWPSYLDVSGKLSPGDGVDVGVFVGSFEASTATRVISCITYTTTATNTNYTVSTWTQTQTIETCS